MVAARLILASLAFAGLSGCMTAKIEESREMQTQIHQLGETRKDCALTVAHGQSDGRRVGARAGLLSVRRITPRRRERVLARHAKYRSLADTLLATAEEQP